MRIRLAPLATTLLATTALGVGWAELEANIAARAALREVLGRNPDIAIAGVFAEPLTGRLFLSGVQAGEGRRHVVIGRLNLPLRDCLEAGLGLIGPAAASPFDDAPAADAPDSSDEDASKPESAKPEAAKPDASKLAPAASSPASAAPAATSAGIASAQDITIVDGTTTYRIKRIDMTGTPLTSADLAKLVDPASPEPIAARLGKLTATAIVVPEIDIDDATAGSERHATITQVVLAGVIAGKIAGGSAGPSTFTVKDGTGETSGRVGALQASNIDLPQAARVFGTVRSDDAEPIKPLYDSVTVTGIEIKNGKQNSTLTVGSLKESGAKARPLKTDLITAKARATPMSDAEKAAAFDDVSHSFEIDGIEATDITAHGETAYSATFSLASVAMHDFADGKVGGMGLRALKFDGPKAKVSLAAFDLGAFVLPKPKGIATPYATSQMVPGNASAELRQLDVEVTSDKDGAPIQTHVAVVHAGFASAGEPDDIPKTAKLTVDHLGFDLPADPGQAQPLLDMGYKHLDISAVLATRYDGIAHEFFVQPLSLDGVDMGSLALGLTLANVTKGVISSNQEIAKASALSLLAKGISLDIVNGGLVDRAIAWKAKQDGLDVQKEKDFLVDFFGDKLPASVGQSANAKLVGAAVAKFVAAPKNLHIGIVSQSGLGVGSMALLSDPGLLIDTLEVKASANE